MPWIMCTSCDYCSNQICHRSCAPHVTTAAIRYAMDHVHLMWLLQQSDMPWIMCTSCDYCSNQIYHRSGAPHVTFHTACIISIPPRGRPNMFAKMLVKNHSKQLKIYLHFNFVIPAYYRLVHGMVRVYLRKKFGSLKRHLLSQIFRSPL